MKTLAETIRQNHARLAQEYDQRLRATIGSANRNYARLPEQVTLDMARHDLDLVAACLEAEDDAAFLRFAETRLTQRADDHFEVESWQQTLTALEETLMPVVSNAGTALFLWRMMSQARAIVSRIAAEKTREFEKQASLFRTITENALVGVYLIERNAFRYVNRAMGDLFGYTPEEMISRLGPLDIIAPESHALVAENIRRRVEGEIDRIQYTFRGLRKDGTRFNCEALGSTVLYEGRPAVLGMLLDVTARTGSEQTMHAERQQLLDIINFLPDAIFVIDQNKKVVAWNRATEEMTGITQEEMIGRDDYSVPYYGERRPVLIDLLDADDAEIKSRYASVEKKGHTLYTETYVPRVFGGRGGYLSAMATPLFDSQGQRVGAIESLRDATERQRSEEQLRVSEERYRQAIAVADAVPYYIDYATESYTFIGDAIQDMTGYPASEMTPRTWDTLIRDTVMRGEAANLSQADATQRTRAGQVREWKCDYRIQARSGEERWISDASIQVLDAQGTPIGAIGILQDITERKQAEAEILGTSRIQSLLNHLHGISSSAVPLAEQLEQAVDAIVAQSGFLSIKAQAGIFLVEKDNTLKLTANRGLATQLLTICALVPFGHCLCGRAAASQQIEFADCVDDRHENQFDGMKPHGHYNIPILSKGKLLGVMVLYVDEGHRRQEFEEEYLQAVANALASMIERSQLEQQIRESLDRRVRQVQTSTEIAQQIATAPALDELFRRVVTLVKERFNYYHTQLFRYEPARNSILLITGYGEIGEQMLAIGHSLTVGSGVVGKAVQTGQPILAADVTQDRDWQPNRFLPNAKGELAVPIKLGDKILGILDVQSDRAGAISQDDQLLLEGLCGQIAIAIEDTRLRQEMEEKLSELNAMYRATSRAGWQDFRQAGQLPSGYVFDRGVLQQNQDLWLPEIERAAQNNAATPIGEANRGATSSAVVSPLSVRGEIVGALGVLGDPRRRLSSEETQLIESVSEQVALALESARLFQQTQARAEEMTVLNELSRALAARLNVQDVLGQVYQGAARLIDTANFYIGLYDQDKREISFVVDYTDGKANDSVMVIPTGRGFAGHIINTRQPLLIKEHLEDFQRQLGITPAGQRAQCYLGVPLIAGDQVLGVMAVQSYAATHVFGERDREILTAIANQAAIALQNARLFEQAQARSEELAVVNEMSRAVSSLLKAEAVTETVYEYATRLLDTTNFYIALYNAENDEVSFPLAFELGQRRQWQSRRGGSGLTEYLIRHGEPLLFRENVGQQLQGIGINMIGQEALAWLGVPMHAGGRVVGAIVVQSYAAPRQFDERHQTLLQTIASQAAVALENARLFEQTQAALNQARVLYEASADLNAAQTYDDVLAAIRKHTLLGQADVGASINLFDTPWTDRHKPEWSIIPARWSKFPKGTYPPRYRMSEIDIHSVMRLDAPLIVQDARNDPRLSDTLRHRYVHDYQGESFVYLPLVVGGQWIGNLYGIWSHTNQFPETDVRRMVALAGQAATVIQGIRQLAETQARARREQTLREVTARMRSSSDPDTVVRTLVSELGTALNRQTFVRLGSVEQLGSDGTPRGAKRAVPVEGGK